MDFSYLTFSLKALTNKDLNDDSVYRLLICQSLTNMNIQSHTVYANIFNPQPPIKPAFPAQPEMLSFIGDYLYNRNPSINRLCNYTPEIDQMHSTKNVEDIKKYLGRIELGYFTQIFSAFVTKLIAFALKNHPDIIADLHAGTINDFIARNVYNLQGIPFNNQGLQSAITTLLYPKAISVTFKDATRQMIKDIFNYAYLDALVGMVNALDVNDQNKCIVAIKKHISIPELALEMLHATCSCLP